MAGTGSKLFETHRKGELEMEKGYILLSRDILNSSLWTMRPEDRILAITMIALAAWKEQKIFLETATIELKKGQLVCTVRELARKANLPLQVTRTALKHLHADGFLTSMTTQRKHVLTLEKYAIYQDKKKYATRRQQNTNTDPTPDQRGDDNKPLTSNNVELPKHYNNDNHYKHSQGGGTDKKLPTFMREYVRTHPEGRKDMTEEETDLTYDFVKHLPSGVNKAEMHAYIENRALWEQFAPLILYARKNNLSAELVATHMVTLYKARKRILNPAGYLRKIIEEVV